ncbi:MAG: GGDEF domain-containing protein [Firmicutes bacterium]|nr:GGDEF domain-containing protein [Bacillota bacterium]
MHLLVITQHNRLVERLRTAFEGSGHSVRHVADPLEALASEAWAAAELILVDAAGDPLDGLRFSQLLRGEARIHFQSLPMVLVIRPGDPVPTSSAVDGYVRSDASIQHLLSTLGPLVQTEGPRSSHRTDLLAAGLHPRQIKRLRDMVGPFGFDVTASSLLHLATTQQTLQAPLVMVRLDESGQRALDALQQLREAGEEPYVILLGEEPSQPVQRKLMLAGVKDWLSLPLSSTRVLLACRRGLDWLQSRCLRREFQSQIHDLRERRLHLEMETSALRNEVLTDPLTGLLNRRAFDQNLESTFNQWERHHRTFVLILGDLDHFKLINDRFGHMVGDDVLRAVADRLRSGLRRSDLAFRVGGEEFAILLPETSLQAGTDVAEKLRRRIDERPMVLESGPTVFPTMSFGVADPQGYRLSTLFAAADQALYLAKHKGRNRVEVAVPMMEPPARKTARK